MPEVRLIDIFIGTGVRSGISSVRRSTYHYTPSIASPLQCPKSNNPPAPPHPRQEASAENATRAGKAGAVVKDTAPSEDKVDVEGSGREYEGVEGERNSRP